MAKSKLIEALGVGAALGAVGSIYKAGEALIRLKRLHDVAEENAVFTRLAARVRDDLEEAERLMRVKEVKYALSGNPEKVEWIRDTMAGVHEALYEINRYTKRVCKDTDRGKHVGVKNRVIWVLDEHEKLVHRRMELATCHQSLLQVLALLGGLEPLRCCQDEKGQGNRYEQFTVEAKDKQHAPQQQAHVRFKEEYPGGGADARYNEYEFRREKQVPAGDYRGGNATYKETEYRRERQVPVAAPAAEYGGVEGNVRHYEYQNQQGRQEPVGNYGEYGAHAQPPPQHAQYGNYTGQRGQQGPVNVEYTVQREQAGPHKGEKFTEVYEKHNWQPQQEEWIPQVSRGPRSRL
ncbi:hypothetical protein M501DRAFT_993038 [Patellaria atrata CBS 101060]|uniref:Uncharacterized protein n=1 Tax=Patellaria atrata CBS 101060 TaxID=1346257 RepID=A0A9P4S920_9PEZI|nr:hypothetical protein M501DRAFT_993038 [Patellaria atrata CBS 101060]